MLNNQRVMYKILMFARKLMILDRDWLKPKDLPITKGV